MNDDLDMRKAQVVRVNLEKLARIPQTDFTQFAADFRNTEASLHLLQTSIQALIDLAVRRCGRLGLDTPRSSFQALEILEAAGHLPAGAAARFAPILGFRNRVVHLYDRIDPEIVFRVVTERRVDLVELLDYLLGPADPAAGG